MSNLFYPVCAPSSFAGDMSGWLVCKRTCFRHTCGEESLGTKLLFTRCSENCDNKTIFTLQVKIGCIFLNWNQFYLNSMFNLLTIIPLLQLWNFPLFSTENWNSSIIAEELKWLPASKKVSSLKPFVRFYPLWNVFWAMPSKGISGRQVTLSQCPHISWGKQNNPKLEPKEASLIIWLPSRTFPLLNSSKGQGLHGTVVFQHKLHALLQVSSFGLFVLLCFLFRNQDVINFQPMWMLTRAGSLLPC